METFQNTPTRSGKGDWDSLTTVQETFKNLFLSCFIGLLSMANEEGKTNSHLHRCPAAGYWFRKCRLKNSNEEQRERESWRAMGRSRTTLALSKQASKHKSDNIFKWESAHDDYLKLPGALVKNSKSVHANDASTHSG